jgi:hypothetical protein
VSATPTFISTLGIAKEATAGTAVAPTNWLRVTELKPAEKVKILYDEALHGAMAKTYGAVAGVSWAEYDISGPVYVDEIGFVLAGLLADVSATGTSDPYTTTFALYNSLDGQPKSYTLTDYNGVNTRAFAGCKFQKLDLKFSGDGMLEYQTHAVGMSFATAAFATSSYTATTVLVPNYVCTATLGSVASAIVTDGQLTVSRSVDPVHAIDGTATPNGVFAGSDLETSGQLTLVYDVASEVALQNYINGTGGSLTLDWVQGVSREIKAVMTSVTIDDASLDRAQGKWGELQLKFTACANTTDVGTSGGFSPVKFTTKAANASGTYR